MAASDIKQKGHFFKKQSSLNVTIHCSSQQTFIFFKDGTQPARGSLILSKLGLDTCIEVTANT